MSVYITSLNSGSNGNCYYVGTHSDAVLIDAGISCRETEKRMARSGLSMSIVRAVFISHEHSDHISGLRVLANKYNLPVYITQRTMSNGKLMLNGELVRSFSPHQPIRIGELTIKAFPKFHDAAEPHSFIIEANDVKIGVFTDIGTVCGQLIRHFKECHAAFLEANYDDEMLDKGAYPYHLKRRIRGGYGHLSNAQALQLFLEHRPKFMTHLLLAHLSKNNNCPDLVGNLFNGHAGGVKVVVASRHMETAVYSVGQQQQLHDLYEMGALKTQLSLF